MAIPLNYRMQGQKASKYRDLPSLFVHESSFNLLH